MSAFPSSTHTLVKLSYIPSMMHAYPPVIPCTVHTTLWTIEWRDWKDEDVIRRSIQARILKSHWKSSHKTVWLLQRNKHLKIKTLIHEYLLTIYTLMHPVITRNCFHMLLLAFLQHCVADLSLPTQEQHTSCSWERCNEWKHKTSVCGRLADTVMRISHPLWLCFLKNTPLFWHYKHLTAHQPKWEFKKS